MSLKNDNYDVKHDSWFILSIKNLCNANPPLMEIFHQKIFLIIDAFPDPTPGIRFPRGDLREQMEAL